MEVVEYQGHSYELTWHSFVKAPVEATQVSGYVFDQGKLLLTRTRQNWTIPGGKPEKGETYLQTLHREVLEETQVEITNAQYLGYVSSRNLASQEVMYQLRYRAEVKHLNNEPLSMETKGLAWVEIKRLSEYIPWARGKVFQEELLAALDVP